MTQEELTNEEIGHILFVMKRETFDCDICSGIMSKLAAMLKKKGE